MYVYFSNGLYSASKTDDISCSEVISALHLEDDPELEAIEDDLEKINEEIEEATITKKNLDRTIKGQLSSNISGLI